MPTVVTGPMFEFLERALRLCINGEYVETRDRMPTLNPATAQVLAEVPLATGHEVDLAVRAGHQPMSLRRSARPTARRKQR